MADPFILRERFQGVQKSTLSSASISMGFGAAQPGGGAEAAGAKLGGADAKIKELYGYVVKDLDALIAKGGDVSYKKVEKPEVKKKSAGSFAPEKLAKIKKGAGAGTSRGPDGVIQIQEPLLVDKKTLDHARRTMSQRGFLQAFPGYKYASGGLVNARNGAFIEVQNRFSDRMLPGKKRTTRIY